MKPLILSSPAKLNLALQVIGKRPDGYHNLKTLFERIDLADRLSFAPDPTGKIRIQCAHPHVPIGPKNLVYRVARLLQERYRVKAGVTVRIDKRIPVAAGLAGGSSNAATALLGLNRLWGLGLSPARLVRLAKTIGCDVPFFLHDCSWALGQERGDRIRRLDIPVRLWHVLVVPRVKMYSQEVFTALNLQLTKRSDNVNILIRSLKNNNIIGLGGLAGERPGRQHRAHLSPAETR